MYRYPLLPNILNWFTIDGADEVGQELYLLKGGRALLRENIGRAARCVFCWRIPSFRNSGENWGSPVGSLRFGFFNGGKVFWHPSGAVFLAGKHLTGRVSNGEGDSLLGAFRGFGAGNLFPLERGEDVFYSIFSFSLLSLSKRSTQKLNG